MFKRKKKASGSPLQEGEEPNATPIGDAAEQPGEVPVEDRRDTATEDDPAESSEPEVSDPVEVDRTSGPFDLSECDDQAERIDLGGLQIPMVEDLEIRVEVDPQSQKPAGVTLVYGQGAVQIRPFSSPRSGGVWEEVRSDIRAEFEGSSGRIEEFDGEFGTEIQARIESKDQSGETVNQTLRVVGVEGPRWMLQGIFYGEGADPLTAGRLNEIYRSVVVVRGEAPMPAKQQLTITVPEDVPADVEEVAQGVAADVGEASSGGEGYEPPGFQTDADYDRSSGPYDVSEVDITEVDVTEANVTEADVEQDWLDLGSLQIALVDGMEVNLEVDEDPEQVVAVTLVYGEGAVQIRPYSATGSSRLWDDARSETRAGISRDGGLVDEVSGVFGSELRAQVSAENEEGKQFIQPIRFVGVNGPGWMLHGVFLGEGTDPSAADDLEDIFRSVVVNSGFQDVPSGYPLPLIPPLVDSDEEDEG